ncbi:hypothetical protein COF84_27195 [Bacillus wiedmannii]|uniref:hypothetical protein n=1 Tax=Bacillus wiedmannii TaxID=1890302 RepID=UPI000BFB5742|nr:hypothetical protein [Bacillus wiedmannii]PHF10405.1 hypothetical protein COF84_27195 [Bacillus wiedmannii]
MKRLFVLLSAIVLITACSKETSTSTGEAEKKVEQKEKEVSIKKLTKKEWLQLDEQKKIEVIEKIMANYKDVGFVFLEGEKLYADVIDEFYNYGTKAIPNSSMYVKVPIEQMLVEEIFFLAFNKNKTVETMSMNRKIPIVTIERINSGEIKIGQLVSITAVPHSENVESYENMLFQSGGKKFMVTNNQFLPNLFKSARLITIYGEYEGIDENMKIPKIKAKAMM